MLYTVSDGAELHFGDSGESPETSGSAVLSVGMTFGTMISETCTCCWKVQDFAWQMSFLFCENLVVW